MKCNRCRGERIIWGKDMFGRAVAINCPVCNKDGVAVRKETKEWGNGHSRSILDKRSLACRK